MGGEGVSRAQVPSDLRIRSERGDTDYDNGDPECGGGAGPYTEDAVKDGEEREGSVDLDRGGPKQAPEGGIRDAGGEMDTSGCCFWATDSGKAIALYWKGAADGDGIDRAKLVAVARDW